MTEPTDPLWLWNEVQTTDTRDTKEVTFGRRFTAIDAYAQIRNATALWGPMGDKWGFSVQHTIEQTRSEDPSLPTQYAAYALAEATLWYPIVDRGVKGTLGPVRGCAPLCEWDNKNKRYRHDHDAPKKALTDAMTKCLSYLGFNADVFLGKFDDNKYVSELKRKESEADAQPTKKPPMPVQINDPTTIKNHVARLTLALDKCTTIAQIGALRNKERSLVMSLPRDVAKDVATKFNDAVELLEKDIGDKRPDPDDSP